MKKVISTFILVSIFSLSAALADGPGSEKSGRLSALFNYSKTLTHSYSADVLNHWIDLETQVSLHGSSIQKEALSLLDSETNQLASRTDGFEWASDARVKFLRLIEKVRQPLQLEYFALTLKLAQRGFVLGSETRSSLLSDPLNEGQGLSDVEYAKLRVVRQALNHIGDVADNQIEKYFQLKQAELSNIDRNEERRVRLSKTVFGRCALRLGFIH